MAPPSAFVLSTSFLTPRPTPSRASISPARPKNIAVAVLDTPASNTYLQRHAEVIVRDFLTRRAVNTVLYYMQELHDGPTTDWLNNFDNFKQKVKDDKFRDGEGYLDRMLRAQKEKGTVKIGHPSGRFSRTFQFTIEPNRLAKRIMDVRIQLAAEWAKDLRCVESENLEIQRIAFEKMLTNDEAVLNSKRNLIFDSDPMTNDSTPLRYKNYIALKTLITQHAIARLLPYMRDCGSNHEYMFLLQYVKSYGSFSDGDQLIRDLMQRPIEFRTNPTYTIQPRSVALQILELRHAIAMEWISVMEFIPEEHSLFNRRVLEKSMEASNQLGEDFRKPKRPSNGGTAGSPVEKDDEETEK